MEKLTEKQCEILDCIKEFIASHGYPPTVREICKIKNLSSPATVQTHLNKLIEKKIIKRDSKRNRAIELLIDNEYENNNLVNVPLFDGEKNNFISLPTFMVPNNKEVFAFVAQNNFDNVLRGDLVIVEKQTTFKEDDIVVINDGIKFDLTCYNGNGLGKVIGIYRKM